MFRESTYSKLSEDCKLDLLQETVNRDAAERGMVEAPKVTFSDLPHDISGQAANNCIELNREMFVDGKQSFQYNGETITRDLEDANMQALTTAIHENVHCYQDQVNSGLIECEDQNLAMQYKANDFTLSSVNTKDGTKIGSQYLTGETKNGYYMYYFQATERDAYKLSETKAQSIMQQLSEKYGTEKSFEAFERSLAANGYNVTEKTANELFQNPNFEKDVNMTLMNQYYGTDFKVDENTEKAVKDEMVESYNNLENEKEAVNVNNEREVNTEVETEGSVTTDGINDGLDGGEDCDDGLDL